MLNCSYAQVQSTDAVQQLSPSGNAYGTSQPIAITGSPNPKQKGVQFAQPGFSLNTARLNLENAAAHSAPNNTVNYGSLDSRRYTKIGHKVPLQSIPQQSQISPSLPPSLFNNIQLAGSYQSSEVCLFRFLSFSFESMNVVKALIYVLVIFFLLVSGLLFAV